MGALIIWLVIETNGMESKRTAILVRNGMYQTIF